jgi:hypothetical protein
MTERKKYDLDGKVEEYPGCFRWNGSWYILVKGGEHYPIAKRKMDVMAKECRGKYEEIVKYYKPRVKRERDPSAPIVKSKAQKYLDAMSTAQRAAGHEISSTPTWVHPEFQDRLDGQKYDNLGFRIG